MASIVGLVALLLNVAAMSLHFEEQCAHALVNEWQSNEHGHETACHHHHHSELCSQCLSPISASLPESSPDILYFSDTVELVRTEKRSTLPTTIIPHRDLRAPPAHLIA